MASLTRLLPALLISCALASPVEADDPFPPITPRAAGARVVEVRTKDGEAPAVLLDRGRKHGLKMGDRLIILHKEQRIAMGRITALFDELCTVELLEGAGLVTKGDAAVRLGNQGPSEARITVVEADTDSVLVSFGKSSGIKLGDVLSVMRRGERIAELKVVNVVERQCRATVVELIIRPELGDSLKRGTRHVLAVGDRVIKGRPAAKKSRAIEARVLRERARRLRARARQLEIEVQKMRDEAAALERRALVAERKESFEPAPPGPLLGMHLIGLEAPDGAVSIKVVGVKGGSVADRAGVLAGDIVESIDGHSLGSIDELAHRSRALPRKLRLALGVRRGGERRILICRPLEKVR